MSVDGSALRSWCVGIDVGSSFVRAVAVDDRCLALVNVDEPVIGRASWDPKTTLLDPIERAIGQLAVRSRSLNVPLQGSVLSVPTMAGIAARCDIRRIGDQFGLDVAGVIDHSSANLLYLWHLQPWRNGDRVIVVDVGRHSCDVAVADFSAEGVEIQGIAGFADRSLDEAIDLGPTELVRRLAATIDDAMNAAASHMDHAVARVAITGGRLRDRSLADLVLATFEDNVDVAVLPRTAVAHGAALHAAALADGERSSGFRVPVLSRLNTRTIGVLLGDHDTGEPLPTVLFRMNQRLPAVVTEVLGTADGGVSKALVELVEQVLPDDVELIDDVTSIGRFRIEGLPSSLPARSELHVRFELSEDGSLRVASADHWGQLPPPTGSPLTGQPTPTAPPAGCSPVSSEPSSSGDTASDPLHSSGEEGAVERLFKWVEPLARTTEALILMVGVLSAQEQARLIADAVAAGASRADAEVALRHLIDELGATV